MGYKDFSLIAFFIYVGLTGKLNWNRGATTSSYFPHVSKGAVFMSLFSRFKIRARTAYLTSLSLSNFSEFAFDNGFGRIQGGLVSL